MFPARGRRWAQMAVVACCLVAASYLVDALNTAARQPQTTDYLAFATGGRVLDQGSSCLYCVDAQTAAQVSLLGQPPPDTSGFPNLYANPPLAAFLLRPLASLSLQQGLNIFLLLSLLSLVIASVLLARRIAHHSAVVRTVVLVTAVASLPASTGLRLGQWDAFLLLAVAAAMFMLDADRPVAAGLLLSVLLVKPQVVWAVPLVLLIVRLPRVLLGFATGAAVWLCSGLAIVGADQLRRWWDVGASAHVSDASDTEGLPGIVAGLSGGTRPAFVAALLLAGIAVALAVWLRAALHADPVAAVALAVAMSLVCAPHVFPDDFILLAPLLVVLAVRAPVPAACAGVALSAAWWFDVHSGLPSATRHLEAVVMTAIVTAAVLRLGKRRRDLTEAVPEQARFDVPATAVRA